MYIEKDDEMIQAKAQELIGKTPEKTVKNIYKYVTNNIKYTGYIHESLGAKKAIESNGGDCTEFADAFIALCRACDIPARHITGWTTDWENTPSHSWVEVYIDSKGWIPFDPTPGNRSKLESLENRYVYLSHIRNDENLINYTFFSYNYWGSAPTINSTIKVGDL